MGIKVKKSDLAYIAGIIDGDGYIGVTLHRSKQSLTHFDITVEIEMRDKQPIQLAQALFGGNIYHRPPRKRVSQEHWHWRLTGEQAIAMLKAIRLYLLVKRPQAELALRVMNVHPKYKHYTPMERFLQEADALALRKLNRPKRLMP